MNTEIQDLVRKMNVPQHKQDLEKKQNIVWLIENLEARNKQHVQYRDVMHALLNEATKHNLMKQSRIAKVRSDLNAPAPNTCFALAP